MDEEEQSTNHLLEGNLEEDFDDPADYIVWEKSRLQAFKEQISEACNRLKSFSLFPIGLPEHRRKAITTKFFPLSTPDNEAQKSNHGAD